ncbi:MAG: aminotransferase class V-fold PLP-dependent enzyme [Pirellulaceae bacterium]|nr:aminotransferase class V-fold PLP-dependent enzyme [Pirellulaceae bacterium]MDP7016382.1 aminotransferase class V-fold PLP-dependent enzyme [Pirellulaceae bacterium]
MNLHEKYGLRRVINACGKMTKLSGAIVLPEIADVVREALNHFFDIDELQAAAGRVIADASGAESGCVTACTSAGITLSVAACMAGDNLGAILQLPDATGMNRRVVIQKGHCVNFGQPITQAIRLAGAEVVEVGTVNGCSEAELRHALERGGVAAIVAVESHHTVQHGWIRLNRVTEIASEYGAPVIVDGAAQDMRLGELVASGADLVITSAHKFLCSTTAGVVAGRRELVDAVYAQNRGIGRGMKAGKEAVFGAIAALEKRMAEDLSEWTAEQDRRVELILRALEDVDGLALQVDPDPNGCPFSRARLTPDATKTGVTAEQLAARLAAGDPTVVARAHHADEGYIYLDAVELTDEEIAFACEKVRAVLSDPRRD